MMSGKENHAYARYDSTTTYPRSTLQADIVHIGFGAFHRGHQAVYNFLTNQLSDNAWGIFEINLFGTPELMNALKTLAFQKPLNTQYLVNMHENINLS